LLKTLEGGCQVPIGAFAQVKQDGLTIEAMVGSVDGAITFRKTIKGNKNNPEKVGNRLAKDLLKAGADSILKDVYINARAK
jgi:hydroxymethylbilane synthase